MGAIKKKLIDDITISEMKQLRASGMTNKEIAVSLDVSYQTVVRYIGKQPAGMGASRKWAMSDRNMGGDGMVQIAESNVIQIPNTGENQDCFVDVDSECLSKTVPDGTKYRAFLDYENGEVSFSVGGQDIVLRRDQIEDAATFLRLCANRRGWRLSDAGETQVAEEVDSQPSAENAQEAAQTERKAVCIGHDPEYRRGLTRCKCPECGDVFYFNNKDASKTARCRKCCGTIDLSAAVRFRGTCDCGRKSYGWAATNEERFETYCLCGKSFEVAYNEDTGEYGRIEDTPE